LSAVWSGSKGPDWSLRYPVDFTARDDHSKVQLQKIHGELYDDVFDGTDLDRRDNSAFILAMNGKRVRTIQLPLGSYELQWVLQSGQSCGSHSLEVTSSDPREVKEDDPCPGH
jgi:hypothetical protein